MSKKNLKWHPKFSAYCFPKIGVMLLSEDNFFWLPESLYPALSLIDGDGNHDDIIEILSASRSEEQPNIVQFIYQTNQLKQQGFLIDNSQLLADEYQEQRLTIQSSLYRDDCVDILNISSLTNSNLTQWSELLKNLAEKNSPKSLNSSSTKKIYFLLADDLLDKRIEQTLIFERHYCIIQVTGGSLAITPVFLHTLPITTNHTYWQQLQNSLYRNKPVRAFLARLLPQQTHFVPRIKRPLLADNQQLIISDLLTRQLTAPSNNLLCYHLEKNQTTQHQIHIQQAQTNSALLFQQPIVLQQVKPKYNKDGGQRTIAPKETVKRLMPFVDNITGYITNMLELAPENNDPIKIYRTAFFKTPLITDLRELNNLSFVQTCLGKGVSPQQSQASALCEAIERLNAQFNGDEPLYKATPAELTKRYYHFQQLTPYSPLQYQQFADSNHSESKRKQAAIVYNDEAIHWLAAWSLTHEKQVYVPLTCCFSNIELATQYTQVTGFNDQQFGRWHSNGAAAGNSVEEAILQALLELIERDATAIWWYNQIERPAFDLSKLDSKFYQPLEQTLAKEHHFWVLDATHDLGIPVMIAIGQHKKNGGYIFGFGCHLHANLAAQRALTELCQLLPIRNQQGAAFNFDKIVEGRYLHPNNALEIEPAFTVSSGDIKDDILAIVEQLKRLNLETLAVDYSRAPIPLCTVKVFVPGLCHIWPQLGNQRLYQVPISLNWRETANNESSINPHSLYI